MKILCTNDDGYLSNGIGVLARAASRLGTVTTVAPDREQSASSSSLWVRMPGGDVQVEVGSTAVLVGPSVFVADVEWSGPR